MDTKIKKGNLTIFFGYCAGVGKTYAMLNAAQQKSVEVLMLLLDILNHMNVKKQRISHTD